MLAHDDMNLVSPQVAVLGTSFPEICEGPLDIKAPAALEVRTNDRPFTCSKNSSP